MSNTKSAPRPSPPANSHRTTTARPATPLHGSRVPERRSEDRGRSRALPSPARRDRIWLPACTAQAIQDRLRAVAEAGCGAITVAEAMVLFAELAPRRYCRSTIYRFLKRQGWKRDRWWHSPTDTSLAIHFREILPYVRRSTGKDVSRSTAYRYLRRHGWTNDLIWRPEA